MILKLEHYSNNLCGHVWLSGSSDSQYKDCGCQPYYDQHVVLFSKALYQNYWVCILKRVRPGLKSNLVSEEFKTSRKYVFLCISDISVIIFDNLVLVVYRALCNPASFFAVLYFFWLFYI